MESFFVNGDSINGVKSLPDNSVHLILSDIPYGISVEEWDVLHNNTNSALLGSSPAQEKAGAVFKKRGKPINGWSEADRKIPIEYYSWCMTWSKEWFRVLKPGGTVFVFAGRRLGHRMICALEDSGFNYKDSIAWLRNRAPHRAQRLSVVYKKRGMEELASDWEGWRIGNLRPVFEPIHWFVKPYKIGTTIADNVVQHGVGAYNQEALLSFCSDPNNVLDFGYEKEDKSIHPTQKPLKLMKALLTLVTKEGQVVLDPFAGSGTTLLAAIECNRIYQGYELSNEYFKLARDRLENATLQGSLDLL